MEKYTGSHSADDSADNLKLVVMLVGHSFPLWAPGTGEVGVNAYMCTEAIATRCACGALAWLVAPWIQVAPSPTQPSLVIT